MKKKIEAELISLAHQILKTSHHNQAQQLQQKAQKLYELLTILCFYEKENSPQQPTLQTTNWETRLEAALQAINDFDDNDDNANGNQNTKKDADEPIETDVTEAINTTATLIEPELTAETTEPQPDIIPKEIKTEQLLEFTTVEPEFIKVQPLSAKTVEREIHKDIESTVSNESAKIIVLSLNDKIAFENHLFGGDGKALLSVINQINDCENLTEAMYYINSTVKINYDWEQKEEFVARFVALIEEKFN